MWAERLPAPLTPPVSPLDTLFPAARPAVAGRREVQAVRGALLAVADGR